MFLLFKTETVCLTRCADLDKRTRKAVVDSAKENTDCGNGTLRASLMHGEV